MKKRTGRSRILGAATALGGMVVGAVVGIAVQKGVESTGLLGPSVESLLAEQESNFGELHERLDELRGRSTDPEIRKRLGELARLLERQGEIARRAGDELGYLGQELRTLKERQLADSGVAGGADFWLKRGESVNVGSRDQVFGVVGARGTLAEVNLNGERSRMTIGDAREFEGPRGSCRILFKQANPRADDRIGFDLSCS